jgi:hypothetical protein
VSAIVLRAHKKKGLHRPSISFQKLALKAGEIVECVVMLEGLEQPVKPMMEVELGLRP